MTILRSRLLTFPDWPIFDEQEETNLLGVLHSGKWWRMAGESVKTFESRFSERHGVKFGVAVSNGTHALELALMALGIGPGDEVIVPAYTFISTVTPVFRQGATPVAVDVDPSTLCIKPELIEKALTSKTKAIIPVHLAGQACAMDQIMRIAKKHNLWVIEDAAHAHGGEYLNQPLGSFGDIACFSFQQMKLMTAGEGGVLVTNDEEIYAKCLLFQNVGRPLNDREYRHLVLGSNYRMSEFQATVLLAQLGRLRNQNETRMQNASEMDRLLTGVDGLDPLRRRVDSTIHPYYMYMMRYDSAKFGYKSRSEFVALLNASGVPAFLGYSAVHNTTVWNQQKGRASECPIAEVAAEDLIWLHHRVLLGSLQQLVDLVNFIKEAQAKWG